MSTVASERMVINGYTLIFDGFLLLGGRAGDLVGRRSLFSPESRSSASRRC